MCAAMAFILSSCDSIFIIGQRCSLFGRYPCSLFKTPPPPLMHRILYWAFLDTLPVLLFLFVFVVMLSLHIVVILFVSLHRVVGLLVVMFAIASFGLLLCFFFWLFWLCSSDCCCACSESVKCRFSVLNSKFDFIFRWWVHPRKTNPKSLGLSAAVRE